MADALRLVGERVQAFVAEQTPYSLGIYPLFLFRHDALWCVGLFLGHNTFHVLHCVRTREDAEQWAKAIHMA